jgi:hypothetical protein
VVKGYKDIVTELLSHGAMIEDDQGALLAHTVAREDKVLFRLLVEGGCHLTDQTMAECRQRAEQDGLDSMIEFLLQVEFPAVQQDICSLFLTIETSG